MSPSEPTTQSNFLSKPAAFFKDRAGLICISRYGRRFCPSHAPHSPAALAGLLPPPAPLLLYLPAVSAPRECGVYSPVPFPICCFPTPLLARATPA
jgi:hypothetical protein